MAGEFMRVEMLPAFHGDCLWVEYGDDKRTRRVLIDGGPIGTYGVLEERISALPGNDRRIELIVLSHVDTDHVDGLVRLFANPPPWPFLPKDVWFNGWHHLASGNQILGGKQGEYFSALLANRLEADAWNSAFGGQAVVVPETGNLPSKPLVGGMTLTLLSPTQDKLDRLAKAWKKDLGTSINPGDLDAAWALLARQKRYLPGQGLLGSTPELDGLLARQSRPDGAAANGSSIAFLAEYAGLSCLFLADAHTDVVCASLRRLLDERGLDRLPVDAVKVSHHGSKGNTSDELMALIDCPRFLISTNGDQFGHPDEEAVRRIIGRTDRTDLALFFNYRTDHNRQWADADLQRELKHTASFPTEDNQSMVVVLR